MMPPKIFSLALVTLTLNACHHTKAPPMTTALKPAQSAAHAHPHLYFAPEDLAAIRAKTQNPLLQADWNVVLAQAKAALEGPPIPPGKASAPIAQAANAAAVCAFVYRITNDPIYGKRAHEITNAILAADNWSGHFLGLKDTAQFHLHTAAICQGLALAYDLLASEMTAGQRKHFAEVCWEKALRFYIEECRPGPNPYLNGNRTMNWLAVLSAGAGSLFIALDGDAFDFSREIEIARAHVLRFVEWYDDDGSALEHGIYWSYGMGNALHLLRALKQNGWPTILHQASHKLERSAYPILYGCIGGKNVTNFCDDTYGPLGGARDSALLLAAEFKDQTIQWWARQLPPGGILGLITANPHLPATPPDHLPTTMLFQRTGIAMLRESMTDPDTRFLALKAGRTRGKIYDDPHCQFDLNSIILDAFGKSLIADPGYGHDWTGNMTTNDPNHPTNSTPPHNTLLVDGKGQDYEFSPLATLVDLSPSKDIDYIVSRLEQGYGPNLKRFDRHAYFIDKRFYVLLDDIELATAAKLTWNFHGVKTATLSAQTQTITNDNAEVQILPTSTAKLTLTESTTHVLPRLQWDTEEKVTKARVAWLLLPSRTNSKPETPALELHEDTITITDNNKHWKLPIIPHRLPQKTSMTLLPNPTP
jgi:hypothetical protein